jgi:hypothetical protein
MGQGYPKCKTFSMRPAEHHPDASSAASQTARTSVRSLLVGYGFKSRHDELSTLRSPRYNRRSLSDSSEAGIVSKRGGHTSTSSVHRSGSVVGIDV